MAVLYYANFVGERLAAALSADKIPVTWMRKSRDKRFDPRHDSVKLMTLHSSKGMEFPVIVIAGVGFMPYREDDTGIEARILYVGMTRATECLLLTASKESDFVRKLDGLQISA